MQCPACSSRFKTAAVELVIFYAGAEFFRLAADVNVDYLLAQGR